MNTRRLAGILGPTLMLLFGAAALVMPMSLRPESVRRQEALRAGMAPAGLVQLVAGDAADAPETYSAISPALVEMRALPEGDFVPDTNYEAWLRGEIDLDEADEYRISRAERLELQESARKQPPSLRELGSVGIGAPAPAGVAFDSIDVTECCGGSGTVVPPDPDLAAGPNHLIAVVNLVFEIYDKAGNSLVPPTTFDTFFSVNPGCLGGFDPTAVYDEEADRFVMAVDGGGINYCIAVTATADPLGAWYVYAVPANQLGAFHDYPHTGVGDEYIIAGANQFGGSVPGGFEGRVWAMNKNDMYTGAAITPVSYSLGYDGGTPQPLHLHGYGQGTWPSLGSTHYIATDFYDGCRVDIWKWDIPGAPVIQNSIDLCAASGVPGGFPLPAPQAGGQTIEGNDWRMRGFEYRNGTGWLADTISCNPGSGSVDCVRWSQINLTTNPPSIVQVGVFGDSTYRVFPDLAVNQCNGMAIGYTKTSSAMNPGIWYTGRESHTPLGYLQDEAQLKAGEAVYFSFDGAPLRWGDYTGMTIDPNGTTFWYLGEYSKNDDSRAANWGTYIGSFTYPACSFSGPTMHVSNLSASAVELDVKWRGIAGVEIKNNAGNPVRGALVTFSATTELNNGPIVLQCTTNVNGRCKVSHKVPANANVAIATVIDVAIDNYTYNPAANVDPDGDSDGTTITVGRP